MILYIILSLLFVGLIIAFTITKIGENKKDDSDKDKEEYVKKQEIVKKHKSIPKHVIWKNNEPKSSNDIIQKRSYNGWSFLPFQNKVQFLGEDVKNAQDHSSFGWDFCDTPHGIIVSAKDHDNKGAFHWIDKESKEIKQTIVGLNTGSQFGYKLLWKDNILFISAPMQPIDKQFGKGTVFSFTFAGTSWKEHKKYTCTDDDAIGFGISMNDNGFVAYYNEDGDITQDELCSSTITEDEINV